MGQRRGDRDMLVDLLVNRGGERSGIIKERSLGRFPFRRRNTCADIK